MQRASTPQIPATVPYLPKGRVASKSFRNRPETGPAQLVGRHVAFFQPLVFLHCICYRLHVVFSDDGTTDIEILQSTTVPGHVLCGTQALCNCLDCFRAHSRSPIRPPNGTPTRPMQPPEGVIGLCQRRHYGTDTLVTVLSGSKGQTPENCVGSQCPSDLHHSFVAKFIVPKDQAFELCLAVGSVQHPSQIHHSLVIDCVGREIEMPKR
mmetsp:Transcript_15027/g.34722  ORF Transcript_15027/g.34722 Transcript_15027/m.34722 type:complete len:209 (-) Transcript_15027:69-695(-)